MKVKVLFCLMAVSAVISLSAQNQYRQERDPRMNSDLYIIPEIRVGYSFLNTNFQLSPGSSPITKAAFDNYSPMAFGATVSMGYHFTPLYAAGVGIGLERYSQPNATSLPMFLDFRGYLKDAKNTPFAFAKLGGSFQWWKVFQPGHWATLGVGYKFFSGKNCYTLSFGYEYKHTENWMVNTTPSSLQRGDWTALDRHSIVLTLGMILY
jgi:hypothetical protein